MASTATSRRVPDEDFSEIRFRIESIGAGVRLTLAMCAAGWLYCASTWDTADERQLIASLFGLGAIIALAFILVPHERIVRSRWREPFFGLWSLATIALATAVTYADGGSESPLALMFFVPLVFAALSYPMTLVVIIGAIDYVAYVFVGVAAGDTINREYVSFFAFSLACVAVLCTWHARNQDRRRGELSRVSRADPLTGALNRRGFEERFEAELLSAPRTGRPLGLITMDLDHFKEINDTQGHAAGDELLRWSVSTMQHTVRPMDTIGRLGGDEFAVLLPGAAPSDTLRVAERLQAAMTERAPTSIGIACFPTDGADQNELMRRADNELYAKKHGRAAQNRGLPTKETMSLSWATALAQAVDERITVKQSTDRRVAELARRMGVGLGWDEDQVDLLRIAGVLHDVGKVSIPDRILRKQEPLTDEEWVEIKHHPVAGAEIVARIKGLEQLAPWIRHVRENFDGTGYPDGLAGEDIPVPARILSVASAFDAMTTTRPYRAALTLEEALEELRSHSGTQFDPGCVALFERQVAPRATASVAVGDVEDTREADRTDDTERSDDRERTSVMGSIPPPGV
jgi:diguanylate cyclase (GGDEF)-like protein